MYKKPSIRIKARVEIRPEVSVPGSRQLSFVSPFIPFLLVLVKSEFSEEDIFTQSKDDGKLFTNIRKRWMTESVFPKRHGPFHKYLPSSRSTLIMLSAQGAQSWVVDTSPRVTSERASERLGAVRGQRHLRSRGRQPHKGNSVGKGMRIM